MSDIEITICLGTTCHVLGAWQLTEVEDHLPDSIRSRTNVKGARCLGYCRKGNYGRAPFAKVNETIVSEATVESLARVVKEVAYASSE